MSKRKNKKSKIKLPVWIVILLVIVIAVTLFCIYKFSPETFYKIFPSLKPEDPYSKGTEETVDIELVANGNFQMHFLELGNEYTGDCTYIKAGDTDILIDAGSRVGSVSTINDYISNYVTDGVLEYVIVTHAHQDHYAGFAAGKSAESIFDLYECEVIIDFALTNQAETPDDGKTSMYENYLRERQEEINKGAAHYTAAECRESGNYVFELADGITMTILDNYYYYNDSDDENNYSVCTLFTQGEINYLLTGDLEKEGEEHLAEMNDLPQVTVYKAGHHGSKTSSNEVLLEKIRPEIVCVCCCAGSDEYTDKTENQFPTKAFIDRVSVYTSKIYVTTLWVDNEAAPFASMNGSIAIISTPGEFKLRFTNNNTRLKDTEWYAARYK